MSVTVPIHIKPNSIDSKSKRTISGVSLRNLEANLVTLNKIYNIILKNICVHNGNMGAILATVNSEIAAEGINIYDFCFDGPVPGPVPCDSIFADDKLTNTIEQLMKKGVTKLCTYKEITKTIRYPFGHPFGYPYATVKDKDTTLVADVQVISGGSGSTNTYNTVRELLMSNLSDINKQDYINLGKIITEQDRNCFRIGNQQICVIQEKEKNHDCELCKKWQHERSEFKKAIIEMIALDNYLDIFDIMCESAVNLPAAILEQDEYNSYYENLNEFKAYKKAQMGN